MRTGSFARPRSRSAVFSKKRSSEPWLSSTSTRGGSRSAMTAPSGRSKWRGGHASGGGAVAGAGADAEARGADDGGGRGLASLRLQAGKIDTRRTHPRRARTMPTVHCPGMFSWRLGVLAIPLLCCACGSSKSGGGETVDAGGDDSADPVGFAIINPSCAYDCSQLASCPELTTPYACQNTGDWRTIPHADSCAAWDGGYPSPQQGQCTATAATGEAARYASIAPDDAGTIVLPDG